VFRPFVAGWYRPTAGFITPSAAYGLLLNIAGIESRLKEEDAAHPGGVPTTLLRSDLPACRIAIGLPLDVQPPAAQSIFQQLHNYPVGSDAGQPWDVAKGTKNNITPVRRQLLTNLHVLIAVDDEPRSGLESRIEAGLRGALNADRYGLPFLGDNNFLIDRLELRDPEPARWYERVASSDDGPRAHATRLTVWIDRADVSRTRSDLFAPASTAIVNPPKSAWVRMTPNH
jgi:CRISPR-associated protein Cas5t